MTHRGCVLRVCISRLCKRWRGVSISLLCWRITLLWLPAGACSAILGSNQTCGTRHCGSMAFIRRLRMRISALVRATVRWRALKINEKKNQYKLVTNLIFIEVLMNIFCLQNIWINFLHSTKIILIQKFQRRIKLISKFNWKKPKFTLQTSFQD